MTHDEAVNLVRATIGAHYGITHLRFETRGGISGHSRVAAVTTLARPTDGKRTKGTFERNILDPADAAQWADAMLALMPTFSGATACYERRGFDVDHDGNVIPFPT